MAALALISRAPVASGDAGRTLGNVCGSPPGMACRLVWDLTHDARAADFASAFLAGPVRLVLRIVFVLLIALVLRAAARRLIDRLTRRAMLSQPRADGGHGVFGERRRQRATALASLLRNAASITIFGIAFVIILGDVGLNLAPVLASAGVVGIALGFGAQSLVQDFLAGVFMLLEDQYGVGDVIDIGTVSGTVEAVSLRITRLRDLNGVVWHVRNGTISQAGNETHGWARAVVDFPLPYRSSAARARAVLERAADAMWTEPAWQQLILDRPEVVGMEDVSADGYVLRVTARTAPQGKHAVTRALRERLKIALDDAMLGAAATPKSAGSPGSAGTPESAGSSESAGKPESGDAEGGTAAPAT